jgi:hypothetical protein|mmetsp:Transcript_40640/g.67967  ORF Transcript_40640/g.67967 Transcript_40640/m.67967 type:complete len:166 (+) Transcript_40640:3772-4269(+)
MVLKVSLLAEIRGRWGVTDRGTGKAEFAFVAGIPGARYISGVSPFLCRLVPPHTNPGFEPGTTRTVVAKGEAASKGLPCTLSLHPVCHVMEVLLYIFWGVGTGTWAQAAVRVSHALPNGVFSELPESPGACQSPTMLPLGVLAVSRAGLLMSSSGGGGRTPTHTV